MHQILSNTMVFTVVEVRGSGVDEDDLTEPNNLTYSTSMSYSTFKRMLSLSSGK